MSTMIISEKSKAAQAIADALGSKKTIRKNNISIYHIPSKDIFVIPLRGHIMQYENTPPYKKWTAQDPRNIITDVKAIAKIPAKYAGPYIKVLKEYAKLCNRCIIGTDADVEGCNIGLIDAFNFVKQSNKSITVDQMWLNTLQKKDIISSFTGTIPPKWSWAFAGESRAKIDAIIGFSATREISLSLKPILNALGAQFASIGRVQTSLLYLLYLREILIREFKPDIYWSLSAKLIPQDIPLEQQTKSDSFINVIHTKSPFKDKNMVDQIYAKIKDEKTGIVQKIKKTPNSVLPPTPLNTSKALMILTKNLGISANVALKTMEDLYLNKIISYPRTDSDVYPANFDHLQYLQEFITHSQYGNYTQKLFENQRIIPHNGKIDAGDHPPITPIQSLELNSPKFENPLQSKVYNLIARHYLALFGENAEEMKTKMFVDIKSEIFLGNLNVLIKYGFYEIAPFLMPKYDTDLEIHQGKIGVHEVKLEEKETQPPPRYTDTTLLKLMEQKNLGTKSTRPAHIDTLLKRQYITRVKKKFFVLDLGFKLIDVLKDIWLPFLEPNFTKEVELKLNDVQTGKKRMDEVVNEVKNEFLELFDKFRQNKVKILTEMMVLKQTGNVMRGRNNQIIPAKSKKTYQKGQNTSYKKSFKKSYKKSYKKSNKKSQTTTVPDVNEINSSINDQTKENKSGISEDYEKTTSLCPKCGNSVMKLIVTKDRKKFIVCADDACKYILPLPKDGYPRLLKGKCKICGFNIVKISGKKKGKKIQYFVCPNCWKKSFETKEKIGLCFNCEKYHVEKGRCKEKP